MLETNFVHEIKSLIAGAKANAVRGIGNFTEHF